MANNIINIDLNPYGFPVLDGIRLIPLHAFGINQFSTNPEWSACHFSQSCIVLKPSKFRLIDTECSRTLTLKIEANLFLNKDDFKIEFLKNDNSKATSIRA